MKYYVRRKTCKLKTNYIYHKMYTCFFLNSRPRKIHTMITEVFKRIKASIKCETLPSNLSFCHNEFYKFNNIRVQMQD